MDGDVKDVREFWKEKVRSAEKSNTAVTRSVSPVPPSINIKSDNKLDEAKRRNKEELVEVLRQRRQSSNSPEPCVTSSLTRRSHPVIAPVKRPTKADLVLESKWKSRTTAAPKSRADLSRSLVVSAPPLEMSSSYKVITPATHDTSAVATKMAERINSMKKVALKPHQPLRPSRSVEGVKQLTLGSQLSSHKKRPLSVQCNEEDHLQHIMDKSRDRSCDQHLVARDSVPQSVQQFRTSLDRITNKQRLCYLNSPIISQHLVLAHRDRINSIINSEDYQAMMINVVIEVSDQKQPIKITCKVGVSVSHVIKMAWGQLHRLQSVELNELLLKVCGRDEYLDNDMLLSDYEYVYQCLKFGTDVHVTMVRLADANKTFAYESTAKEEFEDHFSCFKNHSASISKDQLNKVLCVFFEKADQYRISIQSNNSKMFISVAEGLIHSVKLLCQLLSTIEPITISEAVGSLKQNTLLLLNASRDQGLSDLFCPSEDAEGYITSEGWNLTDLPNSPVGSAEALQQKALATLDMMINEVKQFVSDYCVTFNMPFIPTWPGSHDQPQDYVSTVNISTLEEPIRIKICCLHRPGLLSYHMYQVEAGLYYGGCQIGKTQISHRSRVKKRFFDSITWDVWLKFSLPLSQLPLETRVCFTIHGNESLTRKPIGWVAMPIFDLNKCLQTGEHYLCVWPSTERANPIGSCDGNTLDPDAMILQVSFDCRGNSVLYDNVITNTRNLLGVNYVSQKIVNSSRNEVLQDIFPALKLQYCMSRIYPSLPTEDAIKAVAQKDHFTNLTTEEQSLLWSNRYSLPHILGNHPRGLPLLLLSLPDYSHTHLGNVHAILDRWKLHEPTDALELLNVQFADIIVRDKALLWLQRLSQDDLYDLLPQLVQVVKYDWPGYHGTIQFLLQQAALSPHIAHMLFWLTHPLLDDPYFSLQYKMLWVGLKVVCSGPIGQALDQQLLVVESLRDVATAVKTAKDRQATLVKQLENHSMQLSHTHYRLPISLSMLVSGLEIEKCSFFNSNTVPLKLTFSNSDPAGTAIPIIFKVGDDLRQDMLTLQLIKLMEKIWLRAGLDLKMLTYRCLPTGPNQGILEMVTEAETLRSIQTSHGLAGALNEKRLAEWLMKHNNTDMAYKKATDCFIRSCAGYCVATYVLGICDRHNDNIMVKKSGHMFHIDFGRIFGNAQMFGNIKRDRAPFVLTSDMAYVINGGDTPTTSFQKFTDLCCTAYNELRKNCNLFINLLELMLTSGMPELSSSEDVQYVRDALLPGATDAEATISFTRCIEASLGSIATQINFFIHNLAQMKFSGSANDLSNRLLSFCPTSYSFSNEERILQAVITTSIKRYYPQRYYVYQIEVTRPKTKEQVFRRYSEFHEMHTKLVSQFPDHTLPALPGKIYVGRSQVRQVSEKRRVQLNDYLQVLLKMDSIVAESDILFTFLHQMIRDETDASEIEEELSESDGTSPLASAIPAKVKLQISYNSSDQLLSVMVRHVRNLVPVSGTTTANPYVKVYLLPDPYKSTKKKTKVAKKTLHPTYNETLTYKVPQVDLVSRTLYLCVWDHGSLPKQCLGAVTIEVASINQLTTGTEDWYILGKPS